MDLLQKTDTNIFIDGKLFVRHDSLYCSVSNYVKRMF